MCQILLMAALTKFLTWFQPSFNKFKESVTICTSKVIFLLCNSTRPLYALAALRERILLFGLENYVANRHSPSSR
jgi:hypothetical protein